MACLLKTLYTVSACYLLTLYQDIRLEPITEIAGKLIHSLRRVDAIKMQRLNVDYIWVVANSVNKVNHLAFIVFCLLALPESLSRGWVPLILHQPFKKGHVPGISLALDSFLLPG